MMMCEPKSPTPRLIHLLCRALVPLVVSCATLGNHLIYLSFIYKIWIRAAPNFQHSHNGEKALKYLA